MPAKGNITNEFRRECNRQAVKHPTTLDKQGRSKQMKVQ